MFRTLIYPTSGACACVVELPQAEACNTETTQNQPHQIPNTQWTENKTTDVVIQQHSGKLLMMNVLMSEVCWEHKKWNKIASDIKLVFYSSTITMMHGPKALVSAIGCVYDAYDCSVIVSIAAFRRLFAVIWLFYLMCWWQKFATDNYRAGDVEYAWHFLLSVANSRQEPKKAQGSLPVESSWFYLSFT